MITDIPCLSLAITRLSNVGSDNFAIWVTHAPMPGGFVHHDCQWTEELTQAWLTWQDMFSIYKDPAFSTNAPSSRLDLPQLEGSYGGQLMQQLGISLWKWLFQASIGQSLAQSQGIAIGKSKPLRIRIEICDPYLIGLPWEIMQPEVGKQSISLNSQMMFSRTTSRVEPLFSQLTGEALNILLVLGEDVSEQSSYRSLNSPLTPDSKTTNGFDNSESRLQLQKEAEVLKQILSPEMSSDKVSNPSGVPVRVETLIQPTANELTAALDTGIYNIFFYAGHGIPAPDGGLLYLRQDGAMNGTELAQVLVRNRVVLAVFNACWGAQSVQQGQHIIERSSLAEVLIHHGVPAVLAMRDAIADREALSFIEAFTKALTLRMPIDQAVRVARQQLLTLYRFNQPAWTLPIFYMHPQFDGKVLEPHEEGITELPSQLTNREQEAFPVAYLRFLTRRDRIWRIYGGLMRIGRNSENDFILQERWVSQRHGEIICRNLGNNGGYQYFLKDFSRFGTFVCQNESWQDVHHQEIPLYSGSQLKFGSPDGQVLEFVVEAPDSMETRKN